MAEKEIKKGINVSNLTKLSQNDNKITEDSVSANKSAESVCEEINNAEVSKTCEEDDGTDLKVDEQNVLNSVAGEITDGFDNSVQQDISKTAEEIAAEKRKKKRNKILGHIGFILLNLLVVLILLIVEDKSGDTAAGITAIRKLGENWIYTLLALSMFFIIVFFDAVVFKTLIAKTGVKHQISLPIKVSFFGRYYDRITPWSMGGEPFQMAYLIKGGLNGAESCAVTMSRHIIRFFTTAVVVIAILVCSRIATNIWVMVAAIVSVLCGLILPTFMLVCCFKPQLGHKIGKGAIGILYKLKLVKDYDKQLKKMEGTVNNFLQGMKYLSSNKKVIAVIAVASLVELFATNSIPFFVIRALDHPEITYWRTLVLCIFVTYASSFAPTPGGAGIAELSFYAIFAAYISGGYLFWAVLFWRIAIFYVPVAVGFVMQTVESITAIVRTGRQK